MTIAQDNAEHVIGLACEQAGLSGVQREVLLLHLVDELRPAQIRLKLRGHFARVADVQSMLAQGLAKLQATPDFWAAARQFERELVPCAENREDHEERPRDLRGVTPDRSSDRFQGARIVATGDARLRQSPAAAALLWARSLRPVTVPDVAAV